MKNMREDLHILVADDHGIVRMGLVQVIKELKPHAKLYEVDDYKALYDLIFEKKFDLAILDVKMPNGSIQEAINIIRIKQPDLKILVFSSQDEQLYAVRYLKMGADGFLHKLSPRYEIEKALDSMLVKGRFISEEVKNAMITHSLSPQQKTLPVETLSDRELQVARKLCEGITLKDMSNQLNLHTSTISTYKNRVFEKLQVGSIPELIEIFRMYDQ